VDDGRDPGKEQRLRHIGDDQDPVPGKAVRDGRAEGERDGGREHPHQPDETDGGGASVPVCPDGDGQE
jgi:hypothetical protein